MRAALVRVDVVGKGVDGLLVRAVPLHRHLDLSLLVLAFEEDDALVDPVLGRVDVRDEVADAAFVMELHGLAAGALVREDDAQPASQEGRLAQPLLQRVGRVLDLVEDLGVGQEHDRGARVVLFGLADDLDIPVRNAPREILAIDLAAAPDLCDEPLGQRVHDGHADAVQPAGDLVRRVLAAELAAGVQLRQHNRERGHPLVGHRVDRDAGAVVADGDGVVRMERYLDLVVAAREGLVDAVVDHLVDEVMEPSTARRADVHARSQPDRLEAFEDGDVLCGIGDFSHKKALQIPYLRAPRILPERAVVSRLREAQSGGFCDHFAELFVTNHSHE